MCMQNKDSFFNKMAKTVVDPGGYFMSGESFAPGSAELRDPFKMGDAKREKQKEQQEKYDKYYGNNSNSSQKKTKALIAPHEPENSIGKTKLG